MYGASTPAPWGTEPACPFRKIYDSTPTAATKEQTGELEPAINFLTQRSCVFCVRPVSLFDLAGIENQGRTSTMVAIGGGIRFAFPFGAAAGEAGYMYNLKRYPYVPAAGAFVMRIRFGKVL
jgi:hypothetical protein